MTTLPDYPRHRNDSACRVAEMVIEQLHADALQKDERIASLEEDVRVLRNMVDLYHACTEQAVVTIATQSRTIRLRDETIAHLRAELRAEAA